ncbi:UNVERIFIED_CONTAM: GDSL esterase/lipase [Sesamum latifolium]|uniref:GDSL esterase/lipase n=1 Tax=Sesamum latifolium TaxID=2727402 RepID=A0AAW2YEE5_9LAMI
MAAANISSSLFTSQICLMITLIFTLLSSSPATFTAPPPFKKIYAFGDSYTDTGNTKTSTGPAAFNYVSNPPYGITFFHHPTNRYSDGRIVVDFVAKALSLPFLPPYRNPNADRSHGVNFAVAGATAIRQSFFLKNNISFNLVAQSLQNQLVWFNKMLENEGCKDSRTSPRECRAALGDALIWVGEIGANDYTCSLGSSLSSKTIQTLALDSVTVFLQALLNKGAKYIVVQGLPPTGCITYSFALASPDDRDEMDYYNSHLRVVKNARKYGFKEQYKVCCGHGGGPYNFDIFNTCGSQSSSSCTNPSQYINWDGAHLTEAVNKVLTNLFLNGTYCSPPFDYLLRKKLQSG